MTARYGYPAIFALVKGISSICILTMLPKLTIFPVPGKWFETIPPLINRIIFLKPVK
jgi:hypothetical protein